MKIYTHIRFLQTILKIKKALQKDPNSPMDNFLLANAWYNISEFGNSPIFSFVFRGVMDVYHDNSAKKMKLAKKYYQKALKYVKNDELKAKIIYQLMKVETNEKRLSSKKDFKTWNGENFDILKEILQKDKEYQKLYDEFKKYDKTKYFQKVKQCAIFKFFD